jgi:hypothetical protein
VGFGAGRLFGGAPPPEIAWTGLCGDGYLNSGLDSRKGSLVGCSLGAASTTFSWSRHRYFLLLPAPAYSWHQLAARETSNSLPRHFLNTIKRYGAPRVAFRLEDRNFLVDCASLGENLVPILWVHGEAKIHLGDFFRMVGERVVGLFVLSKRNGKTVLALVLPF